MTVSIGRLSLRTGLLARLRARPIADLSLGPYTAGRVEAPLRRPGHPRGGARPPAAGEEWAMNMSGSPSSLVRYGQPAGRWVLLATVLGSGMAFIDATVVNIALPRIGVEFHANAASLQWTVNGYTLSLASLILLGGS